VVAYVPQALAVCGYKAVTPSLAEAAGLQAPMPVHCISGLGAQGFVFGCCENGCVLRCENGCVLLQWFNMNEGFAQ